MSRIETINRTKSKSPRSLSEKIEVPIIDLHGQTGAQAISSLTFFLSNIVQKVEKERGANTVGIYSTQIKSKKKMVALDNIGHPVWVRVITGSGSHSSSGPVLRSEVIALLKKREMTYHVDAGRGSISVLANSGFELYDDSVKTTTKIIVENHATFEWNQCVSGRKPKGYEYDKPVTNRFTSSDDSFLLPREVRENDKDKLHLHIATEQSVVVAKKDLAKERKELNHVQNALAQSMEEDRERLTEMEALDKAKEESMQIEENVILLRRNEEKDTQMALHLSSLEEEDVSYRRQVDDNNDEELTRAIEMSAREDEISCIAQMPNGKAHLSEEDLIQMAIEKSLEMAG